MAVIDYVKGQVVKDGKKVKSVTEGAVNTDPAVFNSPIEAGAGAYYAPGFGSNQTLAYDYYPDDPAAPQPAPQAPQDGYQTPDFLGGNHTDRTNDDRSGAGAIPDFGSWAEAALAGSGLVGAGGPITAVAGHATGLGPSLTDDYDNYAVTQPDAYQAAVEEAKKIYPTQPEMWAGYAGQKLKAGNVGPQASGNANDSTGKGVGGIAGASPSTGSGGSGSLGGPGPATGSGGFGGVRPGASGGGGGGGGQGASGNSSDGAGAGGKAGADPKSGSGGSGGLGGPGPASGSGGFGGGYNKGGYVSDADVGVPTSMRQNYNRPAAPAPAPAAQPQQQNAAAGYARGGMVTRPNTRAVTPAPAPARPSRGQRYLQSRATGGFVSAGGFAEGGVVPNAGFAEGGEVDRFNPPAEAIASDGITDNQPINADEGEYVIQRESAEILGPEILNALNDPLMAQAFSDIFDAALGLDAAADTSGIDAAPALPGKAPAPSAAPAKPAGGAASLSGQFGGDKPANDDAMNFRRGGYVRGGKR